MAKHWIYFFGNQDAEGDPERKDLLGGKGASLAAMCRAKLPVPPGFTITTECCREFLEAGAWPDGLEDQVRQYLARLEQATGRTFGDPDNPLLVSVRSGAAVSMPGMMDTLLNCGLSVEMAGRQADPAAFWRVFSQFALMFGKTVAGINMADFEAVEKQVLPDPSDRPATAADYRKLLEHYQQMYADRANKPFPATPWETLAACITAVFNSWNNSRAITYRREHDIRGLDGTAVTVQSMFPSEISGIVFTTNPNNLAADEMIIESSFGLGEAVVSGDVHPDNFVIDRKTRKVKRTLIGSKLEVVAALGDVTVHDADAVSLDERQIAELVEMSLRVEAFFGKPMDIEWGLAGGTFSLLQSRAIRGLEIAEDVEIGRSEEIHRLRELAGNQRKVWVMYNLAETLPAPTPLTWDIIREFMTGRGGLGRMYADMGYRPARRVCEDGFAELICGRVYADADRAAQMFGDGLPLSYNVEEVVKDPKLMDGPPGKFDPEKADGRFLMLLPQTIADLVRRSHLTRPLRRNVVERFEKKVLPPYLAWVKARRTQDLTALTTDHVIDELNERRRVVLDDFGGESLKPGFFGGSAHGGVEKLLTQLMGKEAGTQLALTLIQGLEGDPTIEQNAMLYDVARGNTSMAAFLDSFGHRAVEEMELSKARYREDSSYIRQILSAYLGDSVTSPREMHRQNAERRVAAEKELPEVLRRWGGLCLMDDLMADLRDAQKMLPYRETGKYYLMMGYETIRLAIVELGRRWDLGRDVFFLKLEELAEFETGDGKLTERIAARKIRWQSAKRLEMGEVVDSADLEALGLPRQYEAATELTGEPIASGVSTGIARIVHDPTQTADLCTDYILVCKSTDPGWTALFVHARGLIVEKGGVLSHGAIVARDYGIPAIVCPDATRRIPDKTTVRVDGNRGRITLLPGTGKA